MGWIGKMKNINYKKLYDLQDGVFNIVFSLNNSFYLTGGTCLSRFYWEKRYSDDLDFFTDNTSLYSLNVKEIEKELKINHKITKLVESRDFIRVVIDDILQIDFVNDRVPRYKDIIFLKNGFRIDNVENILCNKVTAVIGRDNPKDIFDIYLIAKFHNFIWQNILNFSKKKMVFEEEDFVFKLKIFPESLMKEIKLVDQNFLDNFTIDLPILIEDIINKSENRLFNK